MELKGKSRVRVVILGGAGDGFVAAQVIRDMHKAGEDIELVGFLNDHAEVGDSIGHYPVLGKTADWRNLPQDVFFHCCLLSVGKMRLRATLIKELGIPDERLISLIHPTACIADDVVIGNGALICSYVTCQPGAQIGRLGSIRAGANIGHDVKLADYVYVGPNSTLCGYATVAEGAYVAPNSVVRERLQLGEYSVLAAGAVAFKDIESDATWIGNPARRAV